MAVTDGLGMTAVSLETIFREKETHLRPTYRRIAELIKLAVVGLPLNMDGTESERSVLARRFAQELTRRTGVETVMQDERLTTVAADELMGLAGEKKSGRKQRIDQVAASIILTDYINQHGNE